MSSTDLTWLIGAPQGSGVESAANIFAKCCSSLGYQIFGKREFYSNIKGEHSYFAVRVSDSKINSNTIGADLLVSFDAETIFRHATEVRNNKDSNGGAIIYDSSLDNISVEDVPTLEPPVVSQINKYLDSKNAEHTVQGILECCQSDGVKILSVSFKEILNELAEETGNPKLKGMFRMNNVIGVSLCAGLLHMPTDVLKEAVGNIFSAKPKIADINKQAAVYSYNYATAKFPEFGFSLPGIKKEPDTILIQGHQATALGKLACGCRFQSYYPITPASDESDFLESNSVFDLKDGNSGSMMVVQTEDEISAIGMVIGSALTGTRSSTSTSGPGFSLMVEALGWAGKNEVPLVVTLFQRGGPSTGLPTRHGQEDLLFAIHAGHGEFPRIVYASGDIEESFYDTVKIFNFSEVYQVPVIHMMDKFLASSIITCKAFDPDRISIDRGKLLHRIENSKEYKRFEITQDGISPRSVIGLENGIFWNTGDESDEYGHISEEPENRREMMDKRYARYSIMLEKIPKEDQLINFGTKKITIVSWGSTKGPIIDAISILKRSGYDNVGYIQIKLLNPFPEDSFNSEIKDVDTLVDIESNQTAQLGHLLKTYSRKKIDYYILKYTGRPITANEVADALMKIIENRAEEKQVLTYGA